MALDKLVDRDFRTAGQFFSLRNLPLLFQVKPLARHYRHMRAYFDSPRLKSAFTFQDVYMGLSPFEAPATFSMMPYTELAHGVWYPRGGMIRIVDALMRIAEQAGVEFEFGAAVERIDVRGDRARGVMLDDGRQLEADVVVANADLPYVYQNLLPDDHAAERMARKRFSCSVIRFFWGVDKPYSQLGPHTLFLADDYRDNFESIIGKLDCPTTPACTCTLRPGLTHPPPLPVGHADRDRAGRAPGRARRARLAASPRRSAAGDLQSAVAARRA